MNKNKPLKVAICLPLYNTLPVDFFVNFINRIHDIYNNGRNWEVKIFMQRSTVIDKARNELVKIALKAEVDYIWFLDSDMLTPKDILENLIDMDKDIASATYFIKGSPFVPLIRDERNGRFHFREIIEFNEISECAGVGLGCCLIKSEVFKKLKYPWFMLQWKKWKKTTHQVSEDLYFCREARKAGFKIFVNTGLVCGHIGGTITDLEYRAVKDSLKDFKEEEDEIINDLMEFDGISYNKASEKIGGGPKFYQDEWRKANPKTPEEIYKFYQETKYNIYDLTHWHFGKRRKFDLDVVRYIKKKFPDKATEILDFGCGIGQSAYMLAKEGYIVTVADIPGRTLDFVRRRFAKHRIKVKTLPLPVHPKFKNKFDVILAFDVFEHLPDSEFKKTIERLKSMKKPNAEVLSTTSFGKFNPSHFDISKEKVKLIKDLTNG